MSRPREIAARGIVRGSAGGPALVSREPISFLGDLDIRTGEIVGQLPSVKGARVGGRVLVFPASMGSAGAWRFLYQLYMHGTHPAAMISREPADPSLVQGAILAGIPMLCEPAEDVIATIDSGDRLEVDGDAGLVRVVAAG
jgi:predicted aconitase with swiveling domain